MSKLITTRTRIADLGKPRIVLVHLIYLVGSLNKFFVMLSWFRSYFSYNKSTRMIIAHPLEGV